MLVAAIGHGLVGASLLAVPDRRAPLAIPEASPEITVEVAPPVESGMPRDEGPEPPRRAAATGAAKAARALGMREAAAGSLAAAPSTEAREASSWSFDPMRPTATDLGIG